MPDPAETADDSQTHDAEDAARLQEELERVKKDAEAARSRLDAANTQLMSPEYLEYLATRKAAADRPQDTKSPEPARDLEEMTQTELAQHIVETIRADFKQVGSMMDGEFSKLATKIADLEIGREIDRVAAANPDFWDYKEAITRIARENQSLTPLQAYKIAKADHYAANEQAAAADREARRARASSERPGGFAPGSTKSPKPKDFASAFNEAYDQAFGDT